ncbi:unnamed protein product, partial [Meganyctiphanes norvegica]
RCEGMSSTFPESTDHLRTGDEVEENVCTICDQTFCEKSQLVWHSLDHTGDIHPFSCMFCIKTFEKKHRLKTHLISHSGDKPFGCNCCMKKFSQKANLLRHAKICHVPEGDYGPSESRLLSHQKAYRKDNSKAANGLNKKKSNLGSTKNKKQNIKTDKPSSYNLINKGILTNKDSKMKKSCTAQESRKKSNIEFKGSSELETPQKFFRGVEFIPPESRMQIEYTTVNNNNTIKFFQCRYCPKTSPSKSNIQSHVCLHTGERPFACSLCDKAYTQKSNLKMHTVNVHNIGHIDAVDQSSKAQFVGSSEMVIKELSSTSQPASQGKFLLKKVKPKDAVSSRNVEGLDFKSFKCSLCDYFSTRKNRLRNHILNHHTEKKSTDPIIKNKTNRKKPLIDISKTENKHFDSKLDMKRSVCLQKKPSSITQQQSIQHYVCNVCNKTFKHKNKLKVHACFHEKIGIKNKKKSNNQKGNNICDQSNPLTNKLFFCTICDRGYKHERNMKAHKLSHNDIYSCKICPKKLVRKEHLQSHMKLHENLNTNISENNFQKLETTLTHVSKSNLKIPTSLIPPLNVFEFTASNMTESEINIRTAKPHVCQNCSKRFAKLGNLMKHTQYCNSSKSLQTQYEIKSSSLLDGKGLEALPTLTSSRTQISEKISNLHAELQSPIHNHSLKIKPVKHKRKLLFIEKIASSKPVTSKNNRNLNESYFSGNEKKLSASTNGKNLNPQKKIKNTLETDSILCPSDLHDLNSPSHNMMKNDSDNKCNRCGREYRYKASLEKHKINCLQNFCSLCNRTYKNKSNLNKHHLDHLENSIQKCSICERLFLSKFRLDQHMDVCIYNSHVRSQSTPPTYEKHSPQTYEKHCSPTYEKNCSSRRSRSLSPVSNHKLNLGFRDKVKNDNKSGFKCAICGAVCLIKENLSRHMYNHKIKQFTEIKNSDLEARSDKDINEHLLSFTGETCFECKVCERYFKDKKAVEKHMLSHKRNKYKCNVCNEQLLWGKEMEMHMHFCKLSPISYKCTHCFMSFSTNAYFSSHMRVHLEKKHECKICNEKFAIKQLLNVHVYKVHENSNQIKGQNHNRSNLCEETNNENLIEEPDTILKSPMIRKLQHYEKTKSLNRTSLRKTPNTTIKTTSSASMENFYECNLCKKRFDTRLDIKIHLQAHNNMILDNFKENKKKIFVCSLCKKKYKSKSSFLKHCKRTHDKDDVFICDNCCIIFNNRDDLVLHMNIHNEEYTCNVCKKIFISESFFKKHVETHEENSFKCKPCNKVFTKKRNMDKHKLTHKGIGYKCKLCEKAFTNNKNMERHLKKCIRERFLQCNNCNRVFSIKSKLRLHMKECKPSSQKLKCFSAPSYNYFPNCKVCKSKFKTKGQLRIHMNIHNDKVPHQRFECLICCVRCILLGTLLNHMTKRHTHQEFLRCNVCHIIQSSSSDLRTHMIYHTKEITTEMQYDMVNTDRSLEDVKRKLNFSDLNIDLKPKSLPVALDVVKEQKYVTSDLLELTKIGSDPGRYDVMCEVQHGNLTDDKEIEDCDGVEFAEELMMDFSTVIDMEEEINKKDGPETIMKKPTHLNEKNDNMNKKDEIDLNLDLYLSEDDIHCDSSSFIERSLDGKKSTIKDYESVSRLSEVYEDSNVSTQSLIIDPMFHLQM